MTNKYPKERRLATVLFVDVEGFTSLAGQLDYEALSDLIREVWFTVDQVIEKHGGYIDKHIGHAVMAIWGARARALETKLSPGGGLLRSQG